ncbi:MAG: alpha/beta fold hydrolase [Deltaproteobacteria bacterium]|nr:alpha/beta fold hydrolase [Deltaproteobacteria bacterium]
MRKADDTPGAVSLPGQGPAIVMFHGFTGTPWDLEPIAQRLAQEGHAVHVPLLRGHGTHVGELAHVRWSDWLTDALTTIDEALVSHDHVIVLGFSLGSLLALVAGQARQHQGVLAVGLLAPALQLVSLDGWVLRMAERCGRFLPDVRIPKWAGSDAHDPRFRWKNPAYRTQPLRPAREILVGQRAAREAAVSLTLPTLIVHGRLDETTPVSAALELAQIASRARVEMHLLSRSAHLIARDVESESVSAIVSTFVERICSQNKILAT